MSFESMWKFIYAKNPKIKTGIVTMSSGDFKKALKYAYDKGAYDKGVASATDRYSDFFGKFFGGMGKR